MISSISLKMILRTILLSMSFYFAFLVCSSLPCSASAQTPIPMSSQDLTTLEAIYNQQEKVLTESLTELEAARALLTDLEQELTESEMELSECQQQLSELKSELVKQKLELVKLKSELSKLKTESLKLSTALTQAEQSLNDTEKRYQKEKSKLKRKTLGWQIIAVILGGVAIAK